MSHTYSINQQLLQAFHFCTLVLLLDYGTKTTQRSIFLPGLLGVSGWLFPSKGRSSFWFCLQFAAMQHWGEMKYLRFPLLLRTTEGPSDFRPQRHCFFLLQKVENASFFCSHTHSGTTGACACSMQQSCWPSFVRVRISDRAFPSDSTPRDNHQYLISKASSNIFIILYINNFIYDNA